MTVAATAYVAHPVAGDVAGNVARALRWYRYLVANYGEWALCMPYVAHVLAHGMDTLPGSEVAYRARGMRDNLALVRQMDGIILVGGIVTQGMDEELRHALANGKWSLDLTALGPEPPEDLIGDGA